MSQATIVSPSTLSESYTGSSKSAGSDKTERERELDLTKDNVASPIDLECHIQDERISKILDEAIYKTKLAIALPTLMKDSMFMSTVLKQSELADVSFIYYQYSHPMFGSNVSYLNGVAMNDIRNGDISLRNRTNPELGHMIYILNSCSELKERVYQIIEEMKKDYIPQETQPPNRPLEYLLTLQLFRGQLHTQMEGTAADDLAEKLKTRRLEESNAKLISLIEECTKLIKDEHEAFLKQVASKNELLMKIQQEVEFYRIEALSKRNKKILDTDRQMVLMSRAHQNHFQILKEDELETTESYENLLSQHLMNEKMLRLRRCKVEAQLLSWLSKYDVDMSDKQEEMDEYSDKFDDEEEKMLALEKKLAEQDIEYIPLMEEREKEYHQEMSNKLEHFALEHAAKVLQCAWREVLLNRQEKKKLKKLVAKKIAADEAAAAAKARAEAAAAKAAAAAARAAKKAEKEAAREARQEAKRLAEEAKEQEKKKK